MRSDIATTRRSAPAGRPIRATRRHSPSAVHGKPRRSSPCCATALFGAWPLSEPVKIATFNVNGVNGRLPVLLRWLDETAPDIVCLQELKAPQEKFPEPAIREAGYRAI